MTQMVIQIFEFTNIRWTICLNNMIIQKETTKFPLKVSGTLNEFIS